MAKVSIVKSELDFCWRKCHFWHTQIFGNCIENGNFGNGMTRGTTWDGVEYLVLTKVFCSIGLPGGLLLFLIAYSYSSLNVVSRLGGPSHVLSTDYDSHRQNDAQHTFFLTRHLKKNCYIGWNFFLNSEQFWHNIHMWTAPFAKTQKPKKKLIRKKSLKQQKPKMSRGMPILAAVSFTRSLQSIEKRGFRDGTHAQTYNWRTSWLDLTESA